MNISRRLRRDCGVFGGDGCADPIGERRGRGGDRGDLCALRDRQLRSALRKSRPAKRKWGGAFAATDPASTPGSSRRRKAKCAAIASSAPFRSRHAYRWTVETGIYLAPDAAGRGIGRRLLSALLEELERQGYVAAIGAIALPNPVSVALHERLGFAHAGIYRRVGFKMGQWLDVGLWEKNLAARTAAPIEPISVERLPPRVKRSGAPVGSDGDSDQPSGPHNDRRRPGAIRCRSAAAACRVSRASSRRISGYRRRRLTLPRPIPPVELTIGEDHVRAFDAEDGLARVDDLAAVLHFVAVADVGAAVHRLEAMRRR